MGHEFDVNKANFVQKRRKRNQIPLQFFRLAIVADEAPSTKHQAPEKLQHPSFNPATLRVADRFEFWSLEPPWSLVLGA